MSKYYTFHGLSNTAHWLSSMKHDAIVDQGIPIYERVPIPDELIPADSRVEIDAKIHAGYCKNSAIFKAVFSS